MKTVIIKYNAGNIQSVLFALERIGVRAAVTDNAEEIRAADRVRRLGARVLPALPGSTRGVRRRLLGRHRLGLRRAAPGGGGRARGVIASGAEARHRPACLAWRISNLIPRTSVRPRLEPRRR